MHRSCRPGRIWNQRRWRQPGDCGRYPARPVRNSISNTNNQAELPVVHVEATFLPRDEGGRQSLPSFDKQPWYRPHIVIQDSDVRSATVEANGVGNESYLGVQFIDGPTHPRFGHSEHFTVQLMYHPRVDYSDVLAEARFTIREGARIIGFGRVLSREN